MPETYEHTVKLDHPKGTVEIIVRGQQPELVSHVANAIKQRFQPDPKDKLADLMRRAGFPGRW